MRILMGGTPYSKIQHIGIAAYRQYFGMLCTFADGARPYHASFCGVPWAADNFAFSGFDADKFLHRLKVWREWQWNCLWVAVPDVVADAAATWDRFGEWHDVIRGLGYKLALVAQDGLENTPVQWDCFEGFFIGGSTEWKLSGVCAELVYEAQARGKWVHMGRVNGNRRLNYAIALNCDSVDGSGYAAFPYKAKEALSTLENRKQSLWSY